jgi:aminopeptidase YwaD
MNTLIEKAEKYLSMLCNQIPNRRTGSEGNRAATAFFSETLQSFGFDVECPEFECTDWRSDGAAITANGITDDVQVSPYSLGGKAGAPLITACSVTELETFGISNKILLMRGELTREQFLPKNFPFFQVEEQQKIIRLLEEKKPLAIITATSILKWQERYILFLYLKMAISISHRFSSRKNRAPNWRNLKAK